ncbi:MAG TPA: AAA family ATPase [Acidimicrobiia bacterium]|nr:AAA family ATPase [Acidimicrobiia bacterium]
MRSTDARDLPDGRATATVLFTDLVASTELRTRVGDQVADELRRRHDRLVADAVGSHGGRVLKGLGDGVMAVFPVAGDAVASAVAIQRALDRLNRTSGALSLQMRVGLSAGDVMFEGGDCFGTSVIEAARLCAAADAGRILAAEVVSRLVGPAEGHRFRPAGPLTLKGLAGPLPAVEVDWTPETAAPVPLPAALRRQASTAFVGRGGELKTLQRAWAAALAGERSAVFIGGEPGIGKTRLAAQLADSVHREGANVLFGRCDEDLGVPYHPFVEALAGYIGACPADELREQAGPLSGEVVRLVPVLADRLPHLPEPLRAEPETERYRLLEAVAELLAGISHDAPVLLVLDDLHWATKPSLLLLRHLLRLTSSCRLLVVATYRDTDISRAHPLALALADLRAEPGVVRIALEGLDRPETFAFVEAAAGHPLDSDGLAFAAALHSETEGNPFFAGEVLRHLREMGVLIHEDGRWRTTLPLGELGIPEGVRDVVGRRLARLPSAAGEVLSVAAVMGREFDLDVLVEASDPGADEVLEALEQAEQARLVVGEPSRPGRYSFAHGLVRSTLVGELSTSRRLRIHRRIARILERRPDAETRLPELARHFGHAASLGDVDRAVDYARRAGHQARAELAFEEAAAHYRQGLSVMERPGGLDTALRCDLEIALGGVLRQAGEPTYREVLRSAADAARTLRDPLRLGEAVLAFSPTAFGGAMGARDDAVVQLAEEALAGLDPEASSLRARLMAVLAGELAHDDANEERRAALLSKAIAMAEGVGDRPALARVLGSALYADKDPARLDERIGRAGELLELSSELDDRESAFWARACRCDELFERGDVRAAVEDLDAAAELAAQLRQPLHGWRVAIRRVSQALVEGRLDDAERLIGDARRLGDEGGVDRSFVEGTAALPLFMVRYEQGRLGELDGIVEPLLRSQPGYRPFWAAALALLQAETGRTAEARSSAAELVGRLDAVSARSRSWISVLVTLGTVAAGVGDTASAAACYRRLLPFRGRIAALGRAGIVGPVDPVLGCLAAVMGLDGEAEAHFGEAIVLCERWGAPLWAARARRAADAVGLSPAADSGLSGPLEAQR